jgi:hypothetical protein
MSIARARRQALDKHNLMRLPWLTTLSSIVRERGHAVTRLAAAGEEAVHRADGAGVVAAGSSDRREVEHTVAVEQTEAISGIARGVGYEMHWSAPS